MRAVVTVTGKDRQGIIAKVSTFLATENVNIQDISQTILGEYFAMVMLVDLSASEKSLAALAAEAENLGREIGMSIHFQNEEIFNAMHTV